MGRYLRIRHQDKIISISHHIDVWDPINVGDRVPWEPEFHSPGYWPDDVDEGYDEQGGRWLVITKGLRIIVVEPWRLPEWEALPEGWRTEFRQHHEIQEPPRELWPDLAWEAQAWRKARMDAEVEAEVQEWMEGWRARRQWTLEKTLPQAPAALSGGLPSGLYGFLEQFGKDPATEEEALKVARASCGVNLFTRRKLKEPGFFRRIMPCCPADKPLYTDRPHLAELLTPIVNARLKDWSWSDRDVVRQHWQPEWNQPRRCQQPWEGIERRLLEDAIRYICQRALIEQGEDEDFVEYKLSFCSQWQHDHWQVDVKQCNGE